MESSFPVTPSSAFKIRGANPRRNLPASVARKRGESNFQLAFERAYLGAKQQSGVIWQDFALSGYGVADIVWISWNRSEEGAATLSYEQLRRSLCRNRLTAFEMKITNWRTGLMQAHRYRYFSDRAILVLPPDAAKRATLEINIFRDMEVGLWSFNPKDTLIEKIYTPTSTKAKNSLAREKAINTILSHSKLRKSFK